MATTDIPARYGRSRRGSGKGSGGSGPGRGMKITGAVLGALLLAFVAWAGGSYLSKTPVSGQLLSYTVVDAHHVRAQLEVSKDSGATAVCTVRSRSTAGDEVGRRTVKIGGGSDVKSWVSLRTTGKATNAELVSCGKA